MILISREKFGECYTIHTPELLIIKRVLAKGKSKHTKIGQRFSTIHPSIAVKCVEDQVAIMGRVRTKTVKKSAKVIIERYYPRLTLDFEVNKKICDEVAIIASKRLRNKVNAHYMIAF